MPSTNYLVDPQTNTCPDIYIARVEVWVSERWVTVYHECFVTDIQAIHAVWMAYTERGNRSAYHRRTAPPPTEVLSYPYRIMHDWLYRVEAKNEEHKWQMTVERTQVHNKYTQGEGNE